MNNIVFFDLDNTIVKGYTQKYLVKYLYNKRRISIFFLFYIYVWFFLYGVKIVKNPKKTMEKAFKFIFGWQVLETKKFLEEFYKDIIESLINPKIKALIDQHISNKDEIYIISNAIYPLVEVVGEKIGINNFFATELQIIDDRYTGKIKGEIMYGTNKANLAKKFLNKKYIESFFYSDHYSDLPLFYLVDNKIAVNPDKILLKIAKKNNWKIIK